MPLVTKIKYSYYQKSIIDHTDGQTFAGQRIHHNIIIVSLSERDINVLEYKS